MPSLSLILLFLQLWGNVQISLTQNGKTDFSGCVLSDSACGCCVRGVYICHEILFSTYLKIIWVPCFDMTLRNGVCRTRLLRRHFHSSLFFSCCCLWLVTCPKLPDVPHAYVSEETKQPEYREGHLIHFTCEVGYISGLTIRYVCTAGGWVEVRKGTCYCE